VVLESELTWVVDNSPAYPVDRYRSQKLVPVKGATFPYEHPAYWIVKRVPPHRRAGVWSVRTGTPFHPFVGIDETTFANDLELALFIAELKPASTLSIIRQGWKDLVVLITNPWR
jgi:hypothetical protein